MYTRNRNIIAVWERVALDSIFVCGWLTLTQAWARICTALGQEFVPYISHLMPSLLEIASAKPDIQVTQLLDGDTGEDEETEDGYFSSVIDDKRFTMRTSLLEEKSSACVTLGSFARELREHFAPYIQSVWIALLFF